MQSLVNYRQTALEQFQALSALAQADIIQEPPSTGEVWTLRILLATLIVLVWWSVVEE
jgi:hypothetical protein